MSPSYQCPGFKAAGVSAGIKKTSQHDLGVIFSEAPATAAGVFTRNRVQAAPVIVTRDHLGDGTARAVIANAGNANCCTGETGMQHARDMAGDLAEHLGLGAGDVVVASTGVIGVPLPIDTIKTALPNLVKDLRYDGFMDFAHAIMTTDTKPKLVRRQAQINGRTFTMLAAAKGAGMIRPDMATMLCFICTDADVVAETLRQSLRQAVDCTLNRITIDGDTSTNDMVTLMANGLSGAQVQSPPQLATFQSVLNDLLAEVARLLVQDGEGVTKVVEIKVRGAASEKDALAIADTVAHSPLVKTAFFGEDANWGRIMGAVGRAGAAIEPHQIDIYFNDVQMVEAGQGCGQAAEDAVTAVMKAPEFSVIIDLHQGAGAASVLTSDFSVEYVRINADYRS
jgi:glutamate N-acetyltransferase/amino-acid N-acetyltransferase